ncbi:MAG: VCBS repeat-containing protein [Planctomycetes bacterium]|nr:VCBS repeat-containing protein [Planctomycetota bacterium]
MSHVAWRLVACLALVAPFASAQLPDFQPGRNFPTAAAAFGTGRSVDIDASDIDLDGDLDVLVANGGDGSAQATWVYVNQGGLQGGVEGAFVDESAARFAEAAIGKSRAIELADWDGDGDPDALVCDQSTTVQNGVVQHAYANRGGWQQGAPGYFDEVTDTFWGTLGPMTAAFEEEPIDGEGPFRWHASDAEFVDFDDDGDLDLMLVTEWINALGNKPTTIFLNDGTGRFDELWPWADASADVNLHSLDADVIDLDGDFDLDIVASSRDSQSRIYRNNLYGTSGAGSPFTDMTQTALLDTGAGSTSTGYTYQVEPADLDGDGDFDLWFTNYDHTADKILLNRGDFMFTKSSAIFGEPNVDEQTVDFIDYDGDGDLDASVPNFSGTNWLYEGTVADGYSAAQGLQHRTGTTSAGSEQPDPELPVTSNGGTSLAGDVADLDGDGDPDLCVGNDANQQNRVLFNTLGVPDTHAPVFLHLTAQGDKSDGTPTVIHAQMDDNGPRNNFARYHARLFWDVDGGFESCVAMAWQNGQQFRGVIPSDASGLVTYRVEVTDEYGNTAVSPTQQFTQVAGSALAWQTVGCGTSGSAGVPSLVGSGALTAGSTARLALTGARPSSFAAIFVSAASTPVAFKGGLLHAFPLALALDATTNAGGQIALAFPWPAGVPSGVAVWWQTLIADPAALGGVALSNAVRSMAP